MCRVCMYIIYVHVCARAYASGLNCVCCAVCVGVCKVDLMKCAWVTVYVCVLPHTLVLNQKGLNKTLYKVFVKTF